MTNTSEPETISWDEYVLQLRARRLEMAVNPPTLTGNVNGFTYSFTSDNQANGDMNGSVFLVIKDEQGKTVYEGSARWTNIFNHSRWEIFSDSVFPIHITSWRKPEEDAISGIKSWIRSYVHKNGTYDQRIAHGTPGYEVGSLAWELQFED